MNAKLTFFFSLQNIESYRGIFDSLFADGAAIGTDDIYGDDMDGEAGWGGDDIDLTGEGGDEDDFGLDGDGDIGGDDDDGNITISQTCALSRFSLSNRI